MTQRRHRDDLDLHATGADADRWLDLAQAFAGPPGAGPRAGRDRARGPPVTARPGEPLRIANCSGFYGDRLSAMREVLEGGSDGQGVDVVTGDYLAELTMLILGRDRLKDPSLGLRPHLRTPGARTASGSRWSTACGSSPTPAA